MVVLVLEGAGGVSAYVERAVDAVPVAAGDRHFEVSGDRTPQVRNGEAAFVVLERLVREERDHGIDQDGERDRRLVGIAGVAAADLHREQAVRDAHLVGGDPRAVGGAHRVDQIIDPPLYLGSADRLHFHLPRTRGQRGMPYLQDFTYRHLDSPRSSQCLKSRLCGSVRNRTPWLFSGPNRRNAGALPGRLQPGPGKPDGRAPVCGGPNHRAE